MLVREVMQTNVVTIPPEASLAEARARMCDQNIRYLPVISGSRLIGMITDRDLRGATLSPESSFTADEVTSYLTTTPVEAHMTIDIATSTPDTDVRQAAQLLRIQQIGGVPVVLARRVVGLITEIELLQALLPDIPSVLISDCVQPDFIKMRPDTPLTSVWQLMCDVGIRHIPVVGGTGQFLGMVTDRDVCRAAFSDMQPGHENFDWLPEIEAKEAINSSLPTVQTETPLEEAVQLLLEHKLGCLPVLNSDNRLSGLLTTTALLHFYVESHEHCDSP